MTDIRVGVEIVWSCNDLWKLVPGSLGTSVMDPGVYLVGASGGVYALLAAHLANVLLVSLFPYPTLYPLRV